MEQWIPKTFETIWECCKAENIEFLRQLFILMIFKHQYMQCKRGYLESSEHWPEHCPVSGKKGNLQNEKLSQRRISRNVQTNTIFLTFGILFLIITGLSWQVRRSDFRFGSGNHSVVFECSYQSESFRNI